MFLAKNHLKTVLIGKTTGFQTRDVNIVNHRLTLSPRVNVCVSERETKLFATRERSF